MNQKDLIKVQLQGFSYTTKQSYSTAISCWEDFCCERKICPLQPTIPNVSDFLQHMFVTKNIKGKTLGMYRTALFWISPNVIREFLHSKEAQKMFAGFVHL